MAMTVAEAVAAAYLTALRDGQLSGQVTCWPMPVQNTAGPL